ncbi:MAG: amino acid ABC transporter permease [Janthinobacterium lividum]
MSFDPGVITANLPAILQALLMTLWLWLTGLAASVALGLLIAIARRMGGPLLDVPLGLAVQVVRGVPFLVQVFLLYFGGPAIGLVLEQFTAGLLALSLFGGCYMSEVFRTGFRAVPRGHMEAALCVGLSRWQTLVRIVVPEMLVLVLPAGTNIAIGLIKETAVLSVISVPELTGVVSGIGSETYAFVEALLTLSLLYWGLVEACSRLGRLLERRLSQFRFA